MNMLPVILSPAKDLKTCRGTQKDNNVEAALTP